MLITDQELLLEMIDQIEDKEAKAKYIRKVLEQQNSKLKSKIKQLNLFLIHLRNLLDFFNKTDLLFLFQSIFELNILLIHHYFYYLLI